MEYKGCNGRNNRRKTVELRYEIRHEQFTYTAQIIEKRAGHEDVAINIKDVAASPNTA